MMKIHLNSDLSFARPKTYVNIGECLYKLFPVTGVDETNLEL